MKRKIYLFVLAGMCIFFSSCALTTLFKKGAETTENLRIEINNQFDEIDTKLQPIIFKYEYAKQIYEDGMRLYVSNFDEIMQDTNTEWIMTTRWESLKNDTPTQNLLINIRLSAESINNDFKPAYDIYIKIKNKKNKTEADLIKLREAFEKMSTMSNSVGIFFESAAKLISKVF